ncbi:MAG: hypothetical protein [Circoviridae sp.]|nr:MAG: hypothetical protein [Circoviridae sp.]
MSLMPFFFNHGYREWLFFQPRYKTFFSRLVQPVSGIHCDRERSRSFFLRSRHMFYIKKQTFTLNGEMGRGGKTKVHPPRVFFSINLKRREQVPHTTF